MILFLTNSLLRPLNAWHRWGHWLMIAGLLNAAPSHALTAAEADASFASYNAAFYFTNGSNGFYRATTEGGKTWFWERAEQMEMILDTYERTTNVVCLTMFKNIFNGFVADHGEQWMRNEFNDDIMWMVIACARAHQITGDVKYRAAAKINFDLCYERAWSTNLGGGLWWKISNQSKNACVNGPAAIAAHLLYQICGDTNYLAKAENIFHWEREHLFNPNNGQVYDHITAAGQVAERSFSYNQGTFIGAANFLGHTNDALLAADYTMHELSRGGLMPSYGDVGDAAGFNGICARWLVRFAKERGLKERYQPWLRANADVAWKHRRISDDLMWSRWQQPTPEGLLHSWSCSSAIVLLQVTPLSN